MKYLLFFILTSFYAQVSAIVGTYSFAGVDPYEGNEYAGTAKITQINDQVYECEWDAITGETFKGTGLATNNQVSFIFLSRHISEGIQLIGLISFKIQNDKLEGPWIYWNQTLVGKEKLVKQ